MDRLTCHICQETNYRALYNDEVYKAKAPKSQKTMLDIIRHISKAIKVPFNVPARAKVCTICFKELVRYDCLVVELLQVQKRLSDKINARISGIKTTDVGPDDLDTSNFKSDESDEYDAENDADGKSIASDNAGDILVESETPEEELYNADEIKINKDFNHKCPVCNLKVPNKKALNYHLDNDHKTKVTCNECGLQMRNEEYLILHMNIHNGKTETECSFCDKKYARRANVIRHMEIHFDKKKHQCERCGMFFSQSTVFFNHRLQHEAEDNPLICPICSQTFKTRRTYKRHMVTHQDDRPRYSCESCGKIFVDKYTLKMHIQTHHKDEENESPKKKLKTMEEPDLYTCIICQDIFIAKDLFNDHMQNAHDVVMDT